MSDNDPISFIREELTKLDKTMTNGFTKMNGRVRTLEKFMWTIGGMVAVILFYLKYLR